MGKRSFLTYYFENRIIFLSFGFLFFITTFEIMKRFNKRVQYIYCDSLLKKKEEESFTEVRSNKNFI